MSTWEQTLEYGVTGASVFVYQRGAKCGNIV